MKIPISIQLENIKAEVTPATRTIKDIVGFVELQIIDNQENIIFIGRGFTVKVKTFKNSPIFIVNAPAYRSGYDYKTSFIIESKALWHEVEKAILKEFHEKTGGKSPEDYLNNTEEVNPSEIPL